MTYDVAVERLEISALFDLKGEPYAFRTPLAGLGLTLPKVANTATRAGQRELYWIGPQHWLLRAPLDEEAALSAGLAPAARLEAASVVQVSDILAFFAIIGPDAGQILSIACPLDVHASAFPENGVTYSEAFGLKTLVVRRETGFELAVERSFGALLADCLDRATGR